MTSLNSPAPDAVSKSDTVVNAIVFKKELDMNKIKKASLIAACALTAGVVFKAASNAVTGLLVSNALDREAPEVMNKMKSVIKGSSKKTDEMKERIREQSERLEALDLERVSITAEDGTALIGRYWGCDEPKRLIVAMHGWRTSWSRDFGAVAEFLHGNGCAILFAVQRGQGESGGDNMGFGTVEGSDCVRWLDWLNQKITKRLPAYLLGVSMGATTVMMCAGMELPSNVCGIIADCGFISAKEIWKHVVEKNLHLSYKIREKRANDLCRQRIGCDADTHSTVDALSAGKTPVLFIHGSSDTFVPIEMTYKNYMACSAPKRLAVIPGAGHARSSWVDPDTYRKAISDFWNDYDGSAECVNN